MSSTELQSLLFEALAELGERRHALAVPPDLARRDSRTGELTRYADGSVPRARKAERLSSAQLLN